MPWSDWLGFMNRPRSSREAIRRFQIRALRQVVRHAAAHVPYYRELFRRNRLRADDIRTVEDLQRIPVTTKQELQERPLEEFLAEGCDLSRCVRLATSGSTGRPTVVVRSRGEQLALQAYRLRSQALCGVRPADLRAAVHNRAGGLGRTPRFGLYRLEVLNAVDPADVVRALRRLRPDVVMSRPTVLGMVARAAAGLPGDNPPCRLLFTGGEIATPADRRLFEQTWRCRVFEEYGTNEFVLVSFECPECGLQHTCDDAVLVETLHEGRRAAPGERGRVVGTALHSYVMPFIRFDLDDIASRPAIQPQCSIRFDAIQKVEGRRLDFLTMPDGGVLSPFALQRAIQDVPGVKRFQIEQPAPDALLVRLEQAPAADASYAVSAALRGIVPGEVFIRVETVDSMPLPPGGKHRYIRGMLERD